MKLVCLLSPLLLMTHPINLTRPLLVGHRGAPGEGWPDHSEPGYRAAIRAGVDFIECDIHLTRDWVPVCLHDPWLEEVTDIESKPDLAHLKKSRAWEGGRREAWWVWDLTWDQVSRLRLRQAQATRSSTYDGLYPVVRFEQFIEIAQNASRPVGIYPELKTPLELNRVLREQGSNFSLEQRVLTILHHHGYGREGPLADLCLLQSFDIQSLGRASKDTAIPLVYLTWRDQDMENMSCYSSFLHGVGIWKQQIVEVNLETRQIERETDMVEKLHKLGLQVHVYTFRNDDLKYMAVDFNQDPFLELETFTNHGIDGLFTDNPSTAARYQAVKHLFE